MSEAVSPESGSISAPPATSTSLPLVNEVHMREALKRCSPDTFAAAWAFRQSGDLSHIPAIVRGVIERYMDSEARQKVGGAAEHLRLSEDLGIDSLTLMEIVILAEDVFPIAIHNEELCSLRTVGDITRFITSKLQPA